MVHYFVVCKNTDGAYGECSEKGYFEKLAKAFKTIREQVTCSAVAWYLTPCLILAARATFTQPYIDNYALHGT